ncbi:hypothetical protein SHIRM173S_04629 [Streptomyces hirsutus]
MCHLPGVTVVAVLPSAGPVPPPIRVVTPEASASWIWLGHRKCTCVSTPPAVRMRPFPEITSVSGPTTKSDARGSSLGRGDMVSGLYALPIAWIRPSRSPMSAFTTPQWSRIRAPVITVSTGLRGSSRGMCDWPMDSRITLPPPKSISSPLRPGPPHQSSSILRTRLVSASRTRSPAVGP